VNWRKDKRVHLDFLKRKEADRRAFFEEAARRRALTPVIVEKDFWVCWMLTILFDSRFGDHLVFKGGTSLSKVFGAIARFSEDIDLSLSPEFLELIDAGDPATLSGNQADKWMNEAQEKCRRAVENKLLPELETAVVSVLGKIAEPWLTYALDGPANSPVILFRYPTTQVPGFEYLRRSVKLEFGSLTDQRPVDRHPVRPWIGEEFPNILQDWRCEVVCLDLHRTFWEKATILHVEHHRPAIKPMPDRFSRHYADTAALANHPVAAAALERADLRDRVVTWKSCFFRTGWARYDLARPGSFRLVPPETRQAKLRGDYRDMRDMYLSDPEAFDRILETLARVEARINGE